MSRSINLEVCMNEIEQLIQFAEEQKWEEFEQLREKLINEAIGDDERAKKLQWRISTELSKCTNTTSRMIKMRELFYRQLTKFQMALEGKIDTASAKVIDFRRKK